MNPQPVAFRTDDYHTGGEPFRIVAAGAVPLTGATVADQRYAAIHDPVVQAARALLCSEPRGHADMYGGFVTRPDDDGADLGVLFWHKDGFSTPPAATAPSPSVSGRSRPGWCRPRNPASATW